MTECPICGSDQVDAEYVDIGVGMQQCGPFGCNACHSFQVGPYDEIQPGVVVRWGWYVSEDYLEYEAAMNHDAEADKARHARAVDRLWRVGFHPLGNWRFRRNGETYDLSAACLDRIEAGGDVSSLIVSEAL